MKTKQQIAVFHGTNKTAGSTAARSGVAALGALNSSGGMSNRDRAVAAGAATKHQYRSLVPKGTGPNYRQYLKQLGF